MITIFFEYRHEQDAIGQALAAAGLEGLFPGCQVQVIRSAPGSVAAHGAGYGPGGQDRLSGAGGPDADGDPGPAAGRGGVSASR